MAKGIQRVPLRKQSLSSSGDSGFRIQSPGGPKPTIKPSAENYSTPKKICGALGTLCHWTPEDVQGFFSRGDGKNTAKNAWIHPHPQKYGNEHGIGRVAPSIPGTSPRT